MPTPGVAPRKDARYADIRRRALDPRREPLPTRVEDVPELPPAAVHALDEGLAALDLALTPEARPAIEGHARLLLAWTPSINLTAIRDPEAVATAHILDSLDRGRGPRGSRRRAVPRPRVRRRLSGPAARRGPARGTRPARGADRQEGALPRDGHRGDRADRHGRGRGRPRPRRSPPTRASAGRWPAVTARAVAPLAELVELAFPLLARAGSSSPGSAATSRTRWRPPSGRWSASAVARLEGEPVFVPGLDGHVPGRRHASRPRARTPTRAIPGARRRRPW